MTSRLVYLPAIVADDGVTVAVPPFLNDGHTLIVHDTGGVTYFEDGTESLRRTSEYDEPGELADRILLADAVDDWNRREKSRPFDPNWVSCPGETITEIMVDGDFDAEVVYTQCGLTPDEWELLLTGNHPIDRKLAHDLHVMLGGSEQFWVNRERGYREGLYAGKPHLH